jgi:quinolinate synthase
MATTPSIDTRIKAAPLGGLCSSELTWDPWAYDAAPGKSRLPVYGAGASQWDSIPESAPVQPEIPERYRDMAPDDVVRRIAAAKAALGSRLVILGHHYQRDEIIRWADFRGDSFKLSQQAAARREADYIVFCGVHFMAESADILAADHQRVILPNLAAGCSMADMADEAQVLSCWTQLDRALDLRSSPIIPVTYMNSSAALKAFCGERGGVVCTSSNATRVLEWAFERGDRCSSSPTSTSGATRASSSTFPTTPWSSGIRTGHWEATPSRPSARRASSSGAAGAPSTRDSRWPRSPRRGGPTPAST